MTEKWKDEEWAQDFWYSGKTTRRTVVGWGVKAAALGATMGNLGGSIAAAIFVSLLESYASIWMNPSQAVIVSFVVLILTLLFRPTGLFVPTPK